MLLMVRLKLVTIIITISRADVFEEKMLTKFLDLRQRMKHVDGEN